MGPCAGGSNHSKPSDHGAFCLRPCGWESRGQPQNVSILPECVTVPSLRGMVPCVASVWATMALPCLTHQPAPGWLRTEADGHHLAEALPSLAVQRLIRGRCPVASLLGVRISAPRPTPSVSARPPGPRFSRLSPFSPTTTQKVRPFLPTCESTRDPKSVPFPPQSGGTGAPRGGPALPGPRAHLQVSLLC